MPLQGYATDMALVEWNYSIFSGVWHKLGYGWDDFLAWVENEHNNITSFMAGYMYGYRVLPGRKKVYDETCLARRVLGDH